MAPLMDWAEKVRMHDAACAMRLRLGRIVDPHWSLSHAQRQPFAMLRMHGCNTQMLCRM